MSDKVIDQWNQAAETYAVEQEKSSFADANKAVVKSRFCELSGEKVLDLGCGYGSYTDYFRSIGGSSTGVDGAKSMIDLAKEKYPESSFEVVDISKKLPFDDGSFDIVFCNQVLMDIENVEDVLSEVARVLKKGGIFYWSIVHPAFFTGDWVEGDPSGKLVTSYITPSVTKNRFWGETTHYHRPLSFYLNACSDAGLLLVHTEEPKAYDGVSKKEDIPLFFFGEYRKG
ncbi:MAG: class I SAM-dependent methyltransferase [Clostridiales bacterium]|nr:class I SAM-dependent methyltransferase [Clostridiales bacterium]